MNNLRARPEGFSPFNRVHQDDEDIEIIRDDHKGSVVHNFGDDGNYKVDDDDDNEGDLDRGLISPLVRCCTIWKVTEC